MSGEPPEVLGENISRLLSDNLYDKRKQAAVEIEMKVRAALISSGGDGAGTDQVQKIVDSLRKDYIDSTAVGYKKGGLVGLASVAIGLEGEVAKFLSQLLTPVLELFKDDDARVRYYACEALFNICKVAGDAVLCHFNDIFDGLCKLYADVDTDVKNGVQLLDRLMKDIVTEWAPNFDAANFVGLLKKRVHFQNPFVRQLVLGWIALLLKEPAVDMVGYLPHYLEGLFKMLGAQSHDVKHNADALLNELLGGVTSSPDDKALKVISETADIVVRCCSWGDSSCSRLAALCWLHEFVHLQMRMASRAAGRETEKWVEMLPDLLGGTLTCLDDQEEEIARMAKDMNDGLLEMVQHLRHEIPVYKLVDELLPRMQAKEKNNMVFRESMVVRTACLQWICMLLVRSREKMLRRDLLERLFDPVFETVLHPDDEVVAAALGVLAQIMDGRKMEEQEEDLLDETGRDLFTTVTNKLLELFKKERRKLEDKGRLMIRYLCGHLNARRLFVAVARAIQKETNDLEFAQQLVQTFSWILFTATETQRLREELVATAPPAEPAPGGRPAAQGGCKSLFLELLEPWFHSPVSALVLCLWAQQYELATELTARFASFEPTLDLLTQLDQLVHLLESPMFSRVRLRMLEPRRHPALLRCLLGLAMLLPQAGAFGILRDRIRAVRTGLLLERGGQPLEAPKGATPAGEPHMLSWVVGRGAGVPEDAAGTCDMATLLGRFDEVMAAAQSRPPYVC